MQDACFSQVYSKAPKFVLQTTKQNFKIGFYIFLFKNYGLD